MSKKERMIRYIIGFIIVMSIVAAALQLWTLYNELTPIQTSSSPVIEGAAQYYTFMLTGKIYTPEMYRVVKKYSFVRPEYLDR